MSESIETRIADLLKRMTLDEKVSLFAGKSLFKTRGVPRLGIKPMKLTDGPRGIAFHSALRRCTAFPSGIAQAASWNPDLLLRYGEAVGEEANAVGARVLLGPAINLTRSPLNGRTFEYLSEDPLLNARLAVPVIQGTQSRRVAACVKHLAVNNQETDRVRVDVQVSESALESLYLPAFKAAVEEGEAWSVMAAYNGLNGSACCESEHLLQRKLRDEWGFRGFVVSDWFAARRTRSVKACLEAGLNLEMPGKGYRLKAKHIKAALDSGDISEELLDRRLADLLRVMLLTGHIDGDSPVGQRNTPAHQQLAREMAEDSITLLKNADALLPLLPEKINKVALLGPKLKARNCFPLWGGSAGVWPPYEITPLDGLTRENQGRFELVKDAGDADVAIVFAGLSHKPGLDSEGLDRKQLALPEKQNTLISETAAKNPNTVVVLVSGSPVSMPWLDEVAAVVVAWYPGMEGGNAIARALYGDVNPSGKLPVTFPRCLEDSPAHQSSRTFPGDHKQVHYDEGLFVGYRHFDANDIKPLFPFGHGLSYTEFAYNDLECRIHQRDVQVSFTLTNTGERTGAEVAQVYMGLRSDGHPPQALQTFAKVVLEPGQQRHLTLSFPLTQLQQFDEEGGQWQPVPGEYQLRVGSSSRDTRLDGLVAISA